MIKKEYFAVGTYTTPLGHAPYACGNGIDIISLDSNNKVELVTSFNNIKNPSYQYYENNNLYSITENDQNEPTIYKFNLSKDKKLKLISKIENKGKSLCHIIKKDNLLFTASYNDGCIYKYNVCDKSIKLFNNYNYKGSGPNKNRQEMPHAHQVTFGINNNIYVCDLGSDKIWIHNINNLEIVNFVNVPQGYGPRHLVVDKNNHYLYILCELIPKLLVCKIDKNSGSFKIIKELDSVKNPETSKSAPAAIKIHPSGKTLAASNRFDDTIAIFNLQNEVTLAHEIPCYGKAPRDITFSSNGSMLLIANQDSSNIVTIPFNEESGMPIENSYNTFEIGTPVCITALY